MNRALPIALLSAAVMALPATRALAESQWPDKPVTLIVPFPPGGGTDLVVRTLQPALSRALHQTVIIQNTGGAGGTVGSGQAARAKPDGHTALAVTTSTTALAAKLYKNLPYNPEKDFDYIGFIGTSPYVLAVQPALKATTVPEVVDALKARRVGTYASVGAGTVSHLLGEMFKKDKQLDLTHVPYRGAAPAYTDLIGGQVDIMFDNPVGLAPFVQSGKLIAVATTRATPILPGVPTFAAQGMPAYTQSLWYGLAFPKGTPPAIVQKMNLALNAALRDPAIAADLAAKGVDVRPDTPEAMTRTVSQDLAFWSDLITTTGVQFD
ncbi:tripartite tricarboxylate transporter substrate binding protein [Achromobacter sp. MFA1 R4]|uniref:Bug family tripartite tricarboxylate transporter substrate binding protein n=1 Tax=Achromobacter sp. MFA1 R4 TaxID=1881016 RepID=UPI0009536C54|nr:tripartite tricarboxylate transporter substrate-binding protein [Achromobacter sp. MFA1 R4]SIT32006.1 Tripartite-type tricarboxylate transporter, receptor component TctC [Achromobacter sp. MFA1 R4]